MNVVSKLFGVTKVAGDIFFNCMLWYCLILLALLGLWELIEWLVRGPAEQSAERAGQAGASEQPPCGLCETRGEVCGTCAASKVNEVNEPDEWDKLSAEDQAELKRWLRD